VRIARSSISWLLKATGKPSTWLLMALFLLITLFQYAGQLEYPIFLTNLTANLGLTRYTVERILYLLPIVWASFLFGWRGGVITSLAAVGCMLPRALFASPVPEDALVETSAVFIVGNLVGYSLELLRRERQRRAQLEAAQEELRFHLQVIESNEKRLAALNQTSRVISQSLELSQVLDSAVDCVIDVMGVEAVRLYILAEESGELALAAYRGVSEEFVRGAARIRIGEGFNGKVAETGEPLFVEDASEDDRPTRDAVRKENIRSQLIVPLRAKGEVVGTLCAAMRSYRSFLPEEGDLLTAIGSQIGVAVENARLYEQLSASEQRYRELFESAHDAIWLHDLEGNMVAANRACVRLTGYSLEELLNRRAVELLSADSLETAEAIQHRLLKGDDSGSLGEVKLVKRDGTKAIVQLASSLVFNNGQPVAFQHIARDVTEEKQMQENLRFFLQQITRAQEEERQRIARELHDETIQALVVHCHEIDDVTSSIKGLRGQARRRLEELHRQANNIMQGVRRLSQDLRPAVLDNLGLVPALDWLVSDVAEYSGIVTNLKVLGIERRLPKEVELVLFRIAQEALRNVWKHAQATSAEITLAFAETRTEVTVSDNGKGFEPPPVVGDLPRYGKLGLAGMQERARLLGGTLRIRSELGKGTSLIVELPA
jgi:PAS domain S-box-containing protein